MNTTLMIRESLKLEREAKLTQLAEVAKRAHDGVVDAAREAVQRALEAGRALLEARELCPKGTWTAWLSGHFGQSTSSAHDYMRIAVFVAENGNDPSCVAGLSYRAVMRMLNGRVGSDGRANARRVAATAEPAQATALLPPDSPTDPSDLTPGQLLATAPTSVAESSGREFPEADAGDPLAPAMTLLQQTVSALRRVVRTKAGDADYAKHVLLPLERIQVGMPTRTWFWDWITQ